MSKIAMIYHSIDLDGWMSAAIVKHWFNNKENATKISGFADIIDFIGYNYGQPIPDLSEYNKVIMCDISFDDTTMYNLEEFYNSNFIWIDHHISAIKDCHKRITELVLSKTPHNQINGLRDTNYAACELTWKYFFPNEPMPEIIRLLGLYDSFRHKGTDEENKVLEFQYGARSVISNYEEAYGYLKVSYNTLTGKDTGNALPYIYTIGEGIYKYLCTEAKQSYKNGFEINFENVFENFGSNINPLYSEYKFICINKERFNPINFGIDYHKDGYDGCACFYYANGMYNFSLYNDNELVDCSIIAKQFGGGGHKGASCFKLTKEQFNNLIQ